MSLFGHSIAGAWQERPLTIITDTKGYNLNVLEQLLIRLSNYEQPVSVIFQQHRRLFMQKDFKLGGILHRDPDVREHVLGIVSKYPNIDFSFSDNIEGDTLFVLALNKTIICLNTLVGYNYNQYLQASGDLFKTMKDTINRIFFVQYGVTGGNSAVSYKMNWDRGILTGEDLTTLYDEPTSIKQTQELKILVSLLLNDILTGRRMKYQELKMESGKILQQRLQVPVLTYLQQSGLYVELGEVNDLLNQVLGAITPGGTYNRDVGVLHNIILDLNTSIKGYLSEDMALYSVLDEFNQQVRGINDNDLLGRWVEALIELQQMEIQGRLYES